VSSRLAVAAVAALLLLFHTTGGDAVSRPRPCRPAQIAFTMGWQPVNSLSSALIVTARPRHAGVTCTIRGFPSVTVGGGTHGPVAIRTRPLLSGPGGPERTATVTSSGRAAGFYVISEWTCDPFRGETDVHVWFGLPAGGGARRTDINACKGKTSYLDVGPFTG
jgi:hypothetical protein